MTNKLTPSNRTNNPFTTLRFLVPYHDTTPPHDQKQMRIMHSNPDVGIKPATFWSQSCAYQARHRGIHIMITCYNFLLAVLLFFRKGLKIKTVY